MAFCENCGNKLNDEDAFCENCGEKVISSKCNLDEIVDEAYSERGRDNSIFSLFQSRDWKTLWKDVCSGAKDCEIGIIITREKSLLKELQQCSQADLHTTISSFIQSRRTQGILYYYLDLDNCAITPFSSSTCSHTIDILSEIAKELPPKYIFILGNEKIINVMSWEDKTKDDDDIESDFCYTTLDQRSPWERKKYDFPNMFRVGRLPIYHNESFEEFKTYFDSVMSVADGLGCKENYGLSALVWQKESDHEYNTFANGNVDVSPDITLSNVSNRFSKNTNTFYFNLHGSNQTEYWYGQQGKSYPQAFAPNILNGMSTPFILAVEACYGARYTGGLTAQNSILLNAMVHKCISFLGSSRIAYGRPSPPGSCADDIVGEFLRQVSSGESVGDAFIAGMKKIVSSSNTLDDAEVKTIAEFNLYGDPSISINNSMQKTFDKHHSKILSKIHDRVRVSLPDIRTPVRMELAKVNAQIEQMIDDFVFSTYFDGIDSKLSMNIQQKVFRLPELNLNQKVFTQKLDHFSQIIKVYFDDAGEIKKVYESK